MLGLWANGYRTATSQPGHHQTALQTLPKTIGLGPDLVIVLDALRKKRNLNDYGGDLIEAASLTECMGQAKALLAITVNWLQANRPDLLTKKK